MKSAEEIFREEIINSEENNDDLNTFWEKMHKNNIEFALTGSLGVEVWENMKITDLIIPGCNVLNIGVGQGHCTRQLKEMKCNVSALDISQEALNKVKDIATCYIAAELDKIPDNSFDLAISNLVAQHMPDKDIASQFNAIFRALKPNGTFSIQFASKIDLKSDKATQSTIFCKSAGALRSPEEMIQLAEKFNGKLVKLIEGPKWPKYGSMWYYAHFSPKNS